MWLLHMLPTSILEYVVNSVLVIGIISTVVSFVFLSPISKLTPGILGYSKLIQAVSLIILCIGIYINGGYNTEKIWRNKVEAMEEKLKIAEAKSQEVNEVIKEKIVYKTQTIKEKGENIITYLDREIVKKEEIVKFIEVCPIPADIIKIHNLATDMNLQTVDSDKNKK